MQRRFHVDVVVTQSAAVLELPGGAYIRRHLDEALHIRRKALLVLDLLLHGVDRVARLDVERDRLGEDFRDNLHIGAALGRRAYVATSFTTIQPDVMRPPCAGSSSKRLPRASR